MEDKLRRDERFVEAVRKNRGAMFRLSLTMLRSASDAEEAVCEATACAYAHLHALRNWDAVRPWLMRIVVNACHAMLRRRKREIPTAEETMAWIPAREREDEDIWEDVARLGVKYSVPLVMFYGEDMRLDEIAHALRLPRGTVSSRLTRGRQMLRRQMEKEEGRI